MSLKGEIRTAYDPKSPSPPPLSDLPRCDRLRNLPVRRKTADRFPPDLGKPADRFPAATAAAAATH